MKSISELPILPNQYPQSTRHNRDPGMTSSGRPLFPGTDTVRLLGAALLPPYTGRKKIANNCLIHLAPFLDPSHPNHASFSTL